MFLQMSGEVIKLLPEPAVSASVRNPVLPALGQSHRCLTQCRTLEEEMAKTVLYTFNSL